jgi:hypothetical protein
LIVLVLVSGCMKTGSQLSPENKHSEDVERGRYVVEIMGCNDCHTPGYMGLNTQISEKDWLVGGDLGFHGSWGTAYLTNLRLMLNGMSEDEWVVLARQMRQDSLMAWVMLPKVTEEDLRAVYRFIAYLGPKGRPAPARLLAGVTPATDFLEFPEPH